jgi:hypothetical protein
LLDLALPASGGEPSLDFGSTEILTSTVAFTHLQQTFDSLVGGKSTFAVVAKSPTTDGAPLFYDSRIANAIVIVTAKWTSHKL